MNEKTADELIATAHAYVALRSNATREPNPNIEEADALERAFKKHGVVPGGSPEFLFAWFLFPNVGIDLIVQLAELRLTREMFLDKDIKALVSKHAALRAIYESRVSAMKASEIEQRLTVVQMEILEREFYTLPE